MKDIYKTKKQLINELTELRHQITEFKKLETDRKRAEEALRKSEGKLSAMLQSIGDHMSMLDKDLNIIWANDIAKKIFGNDIIGKKCYEVYHRRKEPCEPYPCLTLKAFQDGKIHEHDTQVIDKDGNIVYFHCTANLALRDKEGKPTAVIEISRDITESKRTGEALRESEEKYRSLVESTEDSIYLVDRNYKYLFMNKRHISRMGFSGNEYLGKEYREFHSPVETKWFVEKASNVFNTGESIHHEHKSLRDGRYFLLTLSPVKKSDGTVIAITVVSKDITEYIKMEEKLRELSLIDELTGIYNRRGFYSLVEQLLKLSKRQKKGIFMLYADVDNLKEINDTFGHKEGDMALIEIADILRKNYRESDIIARIGGDEFVVIPVGTTGDSIEIISSRLQKSLEIHNAERNRSYKLSLSFGIAYYDPENPCSIDELLIQGDKLMYEQKRFKQLS